MGTRGVRLPHLAEAPRGDGGDENQAKSGKGRRRVERRDQRIGEPIRRRRRWETEAFTASFAVKPRAPLVPVHQYDRLPSYYVYAGLVFSPLTQPHLQEFGDDWFNTAPRRLVDRALNDHPTSPGQEVVILSQVLADEVNAGYQGMHDLEVRAVNGREVKSLRELKAEVERGTGAKGEKFLRLDFVNDRVLVISTEEAERRTVGLPKHRVPSRMSLIW